MSRILLVNPWIYDFAAYDFWLKPLGLLYIGRILREMDHEVFLIDLLNRHDPDLPRFVRVPKDKRYGTGKFPSEVVRKPPQLRSIPRKYKRYGAPPEYLEWKLKEVGEVDLVMITSMMTYWYPGVWDTISFIKERTNAPVVLGGVYVNILPDHARNSPADLIYPWTEPLHLPSILEKVGLKAKEVPRDWFEKYDPMYELYDRVGYLVFITTLGCPFRCTYCMVPKLWKRFVRRSPERVVEAIEKYVDVFKVRDVAFFDDAILVDRDNFKKILKLIIKKDMKVNFHLPNGIHARLLTDEIACLMKEANFKTIKLGYETSGKLQEETGGKVFDEDIIHAARILRKYGFTSNEVSAYIMINMPGQKLEDVLKAIEICENEGIGFSLNEYTPIPGTDDWKRLVNDGIISDDVDPVLLNNSILPFWWKGGMNEEEIRFLKDVVRKKKGEHSPIT
ncbi:MAG: radical SAM protein [Thermotoga sp. 4484_232]|nr:MAG: radical SAM protein [Thermotoga sp. 4484_232]RKX55462.1 MAG: radical SAM protein [Thermotoga sp.]